MNHLKRLRLWLGLALAAIFLLTGFPATSIEEAVRHAANLQCVRCHQPTLSRDAAHPHLHLPFFDRQCIACHLSADSEWLAQVAAQPPEVFTGTPVTQELLWRKRDIFSGPAEPTTAHLVVVDGLTADRRYRFRFVLGASADPADTDIAGPWTGLAPIEFIGPEVGDRVLHLGDPLDGRIFAAALYASGGSALVAEWQSAVPAVGRVELEPLDGLAVDGRETTAGTPPPTAVAAADEAAPHPRLRPPEAITIEVCFDCHQQITSGASHPVRIYSRGPETKIPEDLPTIDGGMITCVTCHAPHAGAGAKLVREKITTKLCVACHYTFQGTSKSTTF